MRRLTFSEFCQRSCIKHKNKYDYSRVEYVNGKKNVIIVCPIHGEFYQTPWTHLMGGGCTKCRNVKPRLSTIKFVEKSSHIHNNKYDYSKAKYQRNSVKVCITCAKHGEFWQTPASHMAGCGCRKCKYEKLLTTTSSKVENDFLDYIKIPTGNRQKVIRGYYVDGIKDDVIYEFLGDYWHGNPLLYDGSEYNESLNKTFGELYENTFKRFYKLKMEGYEIQYIWENDWNKFKKGMTNSPSVMSYN